MYKLIFCDDDPSTQKYHRKYVISCPLQTLWCIAAFLKANSWITSPSRLTVILILMKHGSDYQKSWKYPCSWKKYISKNFLSLIHWYSSAIQGWWKCPGISEQIFLNQYNAEFDSDTDDSRGRLWGKWWWWNWNRHWGWQEITCKNMKIVIIHCNYLFENTIYANHDCFYLLCLLLLFSLLFSCFCYCLMFFPLLNINAICNTSFSGNSLLITSSIF